MRDPRRSFLSSLKERRDTAPHVRWRANRSEERAGDAAAGEHPGRGEAYDVATSSRTVRHTRRTGAELNALTFVIGLLLGVLGSTVAAASQPPALPVEHVRGVYLQRAIEVATVGSRVILLTRMTRFRRCGRFRGRAEDFNDHLVDAAGRDVPGIGFVAGLVNTIEGCAAQAPPRERRRSSGGESHG